MRTQQFVVRLTAEERLLVERAARSNKRSARQRQHARILLLADAAQAGGRAACGLVGEQTVRGSILPTGCAAPPSARPRTSRASGCRRPAAW